MAIFFRSRDFGRLAVLSKGLRFDRSPFFTLGNGADLPTIHRVYLLRGSAGASPSRRKFITDISVRQLRCDYRWPNKQLIGGHVFAAVKPNCVELHFALQSVGNVTKVTQRAGSEARLQVSGW